MKECKISGFMVQPFCRVACLALLLVHSGWVLVQVNDDVPRRSRYYQRLMDVPLLKSSKETKYRNLSDTYVIFIMEQRKV